METAAAALQVHKRLPTPLHRHWARGSRDASSSLPAANRSFIDAVRARGFFTAIETNGTFAAPASLDWICVSPKAGTIIRQITGQELKLVFPQPGARPEQFEELNFQHFFLQPMDDPERARNTQMAIAYCLVHPRWQSSNAQTDGHPLAIHAYQPMAKVTSLGEIVSIVFRN